MAKSRNHNSELDQIRQELKNCKSHVKHLKRELSKANKNYHRLEDLEEIAKEVGLKEIIPVKLSACPECGSDMISTKLADIRVLHKCSKCKYRKAEKLK